MLKILNLFVKLAKTKFDLSNIQTQQINFINFNNEKPYTPS